MSTLKVNTVQHNTSGFNNVVQFTDGAGTQNGTLCRAWVNFNGTGTVAIRGSFNVSSITDNGTGDYTVNYTNSVSDSNCSILATGGRNPDGTGGERLTSTYIDRYSASSMRVLNNETYSGGTLDPPAMSVAVFR